MAPISANISKTMRTVPSIVAPLDFNAAARMTAACEDHRKQRF
jgi:hypothetical protein